jgi:hypothetical protein
MLQTPLIMHRTEKMKNKKMKEEEMPDIPPSKMKMRISNLSHHLTIIPKLVVLIITHLINSHIVSLSSDVAQRVTILGFVIHGSFAVVIARAIRLAICIEEDAEARDADAAKDAEDVALVLVELGRGFAAEDEEVVAEKGLDACEAEVGEARAVVEEGVDALG